MAEREASLNPVALRLGTLLRRGTRISPRRRWRDLSVTTKFAAAFATFLSLILIVALISFLSLTVVRRQVQDSIIASMEIQRLVLQMDATLQHARLLQRDFFLRWPESDREGEANLRSGQSRADPAGDRFQRSVAPTDCQLGRCRRGPA